MRQIWTARETQSHHCIPSSQHRGEANRQRTAREGQDRSRAGAGRWRSLCLLVFVSAFLVATPLASAADPLGATLHKDGTTTFRVWAPFVDNVAVKLNGGAVVPLAPEP